MFLPEWLIVLLIIWLIYLLVKVIQLRNYVLRLKEIVYLLEQPEIKPEVKSRLISKEKLHDEVSIPPDDLESRLGDMEDRGWDGSYK